MRFIGRNDSSPVTDGPAGHEAARGEYSCHFLAQGKAGMLDAHLAMVGLPVIVDQIVAVIRVEDRYSLITKI